MSKELVELLNDFRVEAQCESNEDLAQAIIRAGYTKNKLNKVLDGIAYNPGVYFADKYIGKHIRVFIEEVE